MNVLELLLLVGCYGCNRGYCMTASPTPPDEQVQNYTELPECINVTFQREHLHYSSGGGLQIDIGHQLLDVLMASTDVFNDTLDFCYPLSAQLRQCPTVRYPAGTYQIANHSLVHENITAPLGDYYVDDDDSVLTCTAPNRSDRSVPRCNYISLDNGEYHVLQDGHIDIGAPMAVALPYTIDDDNRATVCYPLRVEFLDCGIKVVLPPSAFEVTQDFRLFYKKHEMYLDAGDYFTYDDAAVVCAVQEALDTITLLSTVYGVFDGLSLLCLLVTLVHQATARDLERHSKCRLCHVACMVILYVAIAYRKFVDGVDSAACYAVFLVIYLSSMAAFSWMTIMALDVWQSLGRLQRLTFRSCSFFYYCVLAWGFPAFLGCVAVTVDRRDVVPDILPLYPRMAHMYWFNNRSTTWMFYYGPLFLLMTLNLILFLLTAVTVHYGGNGTALVHKRLNRKLLIVCTKLFLVMALSSTAEAICWGLDESDSLYCWSVSDGITSLQGVTIFIIYTCNRQNYRYFYNWIYGGRIGQWTNLSPAPSGTELA